MNKDKSPDFIREYCKKYPVFYYTVANIFGPVFLWGLGPKGFLEKYNISEKILNIGSGPKNFGKGVLNFDIEKYPGVDIVGDIQNTALKDGEFSGIICDSVLEHIKDPRKAVSEMHRILKPGGLLYVGTPFLYPFHSAPSDFQRWTREGLIELLKDFEITESGTRSGPFSTLTVYLCYLFSTIFSFGSKSVYVFLNNISIFIFFPIKFLDIVFHYWPKSENMAAVLYVVAKKK